MGPSIWQILIVLLIVLLLFGTKKLRNVGSDLGEAIKGFKKGLSDDDAPAGQLGDQSREGERKAERDNDTVQR